VRTHLGVEDLGGLLDEPLLAVLATLRKDGSVLLSPVWFEWRDGGFNVWCGAVDVKARHLRRDPRASIVVAENGGDNRGLEVRGTAELIEAETRATALRIVARYVGEDAAARFVDANPGPDIVIRLEPGTTRGWDFADER
jgi:PPOX class probable F420-dependent enzyme